MEPIETINHEGLKVEVYLDEYPLGPREWDNLGTMVCFHRRYDLGDYGGTHRDGGMWHMHSPEAFKEWLGANAEQIIALPLYLLDHSGLWMNTGGFSRVDPQRWDWGMVGYIFTDRDKIREEFPNWKRLSAKRRRQIKGILRAEVELYSQYLEGAVYGYTAKCARCGTKVDSCWGFYGHDWNKSGLLDSATEGAACPYCGGEEFPLLM